MSGLPTLRVELDDGTGTFPHDISAYVDMRAGWSASMGRGTEDSDTEEGILTLRLKNNDGRFTLGNPTYPVFIDQRIRLTELIGATVSARHTGYVQDWSPAWDSPNGDVASVPVSSIDRQSRLARRKLRSVIENEIMADGPAVYYTMGDPAESTAAGESSGNGKLPLTQAGTGAAVAFGTAVGPPTDDLTAAQFSGGKYLSAAIPRPGGNFTVECWFSCPAPSGSSTQPLVLFVKNNGVIQGGMVISLSTGTLAGVDTESAGNVANGATHHAALTVSGLASELFLDGVSVDTGALLSPLTATDFLTVGATITPGTGSLTGVVAHVAVYDSVLSAARIASHYQAGVDAFATESSDERLARLATYARIDVSEQDFEAGAVQNVPAAATAGASPLEAMRQIVRAEGGALFFAGDGSLTFHNRTHRVLAATQTAALALSGDEFDKRDDLKFSRPKDYLNNRVTGSRVGGADQEASDVASLDEFDEYPHEMTGLLLLTDAEVLDAITWRARMYSTPRARLSEFTIDLISSDLALVEAALALSIGDRVTIGTLPSTAPLTTADVIIEGRSEEQNRGAWSLTFRCAPADLFRAWVLQDPTYGQLGVTTRLHY